MLPATECHCNSLVPERSEALQFLAPLWCGPFHHKCLYEMCLCAAPKMPF
jgi:hypothetical protein